MSDANVGLVQSLYAAFGRGEIDAIVGAMTADSTWGIIGREGDFPTIGIRHGPAGVQDFFKTVAEHLTFTEFSPKEFYPSGDKVFVLGRYAATVKKTGSPIDSEWCHIFTIRDGKVVSFREFTDTAQAAEAYRA
jgi:ketosteroid isomerase-like protein